jgi:ABC-2 type transport system ATP-binding protein
VKQYSGGMIRKLEIAQSMLHRPAILFLDEPTVGLDLVAKQSVWKNIRDLREEIGTTVLMTTHDMQEADELCDAVAFMHSGQIAALGSPEALKSALGADASLGDVFIHYTGATISEGGDFRDAARTRSTTKRLG